MTTKCNILFSADENTLKQNKFQKSGLFNNGFYGQDIVMAFLPPEYCRLFAFKNGLQRKAGGGGGGPEDSRAPQESPKLHHC